MFKPPRKRLLYHLLGTCFVQTMLIEGAVKIHPLKAHLEMNSNMPFCEHMRTRIFKTLCAIPFRKPVSSTLYQHAFRNNLKCRLNIPLLLHAVPAQHGAHGVPCEFLSHTMIGQSTRGGGSDHKAVYDALV